jgi:hypothetical protein
VAGEPRPDEIVRTVTSRCLEDQLAPLRVQQEDRCGRRAEDAPRYLHDRLQEAALGDIGIRGCHDGLRYLAGH